MKKILIGLFCIFLLGCQEEFSRGEMVSVSGVGFGSPTYEAVVEKNLGSFVIVREINKISPDLVYRQVPKSLIKKHDMIDYFAWRDLIFFLVGFAAGAFFIYKPGK